MALFKSSNPALGSQVFQNAKMGMDRSMQASNENALSRPAAAGQEVMTISGTVNKVAFMGLIVFAFAAATWFAVLANPALGAPLSIGGAIAGLVTAMVIIFKKTWAPMLAPVYCLFEGLFVGGVSVSYAAMYEGIVVQAVFLTIGILFALLGVYKSGLIKVTENFKLMVAAATGGVFIFYIIAFVLSFWGISVPLIHSSSMMGIGFSFFVIALASMNLVIDFDFIEEGAEVGAPKYMEWYAAFGLMVTLIWLYIEILRLLAKLQSRD